MVRLRSDFWVSAYLRLCGVEGIPAVLRRRGDADAGSIFIKVDHMDYTASLYAPAPSSFDREEDERVFHKILGPVFPGDIEEKIERELKFDSDLWVLEVDYPKELENLSVLKL